MTKITDRQVPRRYLAPEWTAAYLVVRSDGLDIDPFAHRMLRQGGYFFDPDLNGFVLELASFPASFYVLFSAHALCALEVCVPYDPSWYSPRSPYPVFEKLPGEFEGFPAPSEPDFAAYWFQKRGCADPFLSLWRDGWSLPGGASVTPAQAVAQGWRVLATLREVRMMMEVMLDEANAKRASHAELERLLDAQGLAAIRVARESGRLLRIVR